MSTVQALTTAREAGRRAYDRGDVRVPAADPYLRDLTGPIIGPAAADVMHAWQDGWDAALTATIPPVLVGPAPQALSLFAAPDPLGTLDMFPEEA